METVPMPDLDDRDVKAIDATLPPATGPGRARRALAAVGERAHDLRNDAGRFVAGHAVSSIVVAALGGAAAMTLLLRSVSGRRSS